MAEDIIVKEKKGDKLRTVKIKNGWSVESTKDKNSQSFVAKKKFFNPHEGGFSSGEITYSAYYSKGGKAKNVEVDSEDL